MAAVDFAEEHVDPEEEVEKKKAVRRVDGPSIWVLCWTYQELGTYFTSIFIHL